MKTTYNPKSKTIKIDVMLSEAHSMADNGLDLWLTPGATAPYWASNRSFIYDKIVASPHDFLDALGYDAFEDDPDYDANDESASIVVDWIDSAPFVR